jgi:hypothetical protein
MPAFKSGGREWLLSLDAPKVQAVRDECNVNLAVSGSEEFDLREIAQDPVKLPYVLWVLCRKQAEAAGLNQEQFVEQIIGDVTEDAGIALVDAIVDFIPSRTRREAIRRAWASDLEGMRLADAITMERLPELASPQKETIRARVNEIFDKQLTQLKSATDSPANLESQPTAKPGAS